MGRNPKPYHLQLLEGNKNRKTKAELQRLEKAGESLTFASDAIKPPVWMSSDAKKIFKKMVKEFEGTGLLVNVDSYALSMFCDAYSDYIRYTRIISEDGDTMEYTNKSEVTNIVPHPLITKKAQAFQQMDRMMSKFGLSPVDRSKLIQAMHPPEEEEDEKFGNRL